MNKEHVCKACFKVLAVGELADLEIKCPRCGTFNSIKYFSQAYLTHSKISSTIVDSNN